MIHKYQDDIVTAAATQLEVKTTPEGYIAGYGSTFDNKPDRASDIVLPGAFQKSLARHVATGERPLMLWQHQMESPIGKWTVIKEDGRGLYVEGKLNLKTTAGREAFEHLKAGDIGSMSIGYTIPKGGREYAEKGVFHLKEVDLYEISIVSVPANPNARVNAVKSLSSKSEAIDMLRMNGLSRKAAARFAAGGWKALSNQSYDETKINELARQIERVTQQIGN